MGKQEDANLILKLYELRREEVMRKARDWFFGFNPGSTQDVMEAARGAHSAYFRMVTSYWDMACSFVNHGAIDEEMFNDAHGEHNAVFAKLEPFIPEMRAVSKNPKYLLHLEQVVMRQPEAKERLEHLRAMLKQIAAGRAEAAK